MNSFTVIISVIALVSSTVALALIINFKKELSSFFTSSAKFNLEKELKHHQARQHELKSLGEVIRGSQEKIERLQGASMQKFSLVRFNPFRDTGGDQSFCLCILDLNDSGILVTAIHGRDGTRIYAKSIEHGLSKQELSAEEKKALKEAMKDIS